MAQPKFKSVEDYLLNAPAETRDILAPVRAEIRDILPASTEYLCYNIPTYWMGGRAVIHFVGWKDRWSLYPVGARFAEGHPQAAASFEISKGTIRVPWSHGVPDNYCAPPSCSGWPRWPMRVIPNPRTQTRRDSQTLAREACR